MWSGGWMCAHKHELCVLVCTYARVDCLPLSNHHRTQARIARVCHTSNRFNRNVPMLLSTVASHMRFDFICWQWRHSNNIWYKLYYNCISLLLNTTVVQISAELVFYLFSNRFLASKQLSFIISNLNGWPSTRILRRNQLKRVLIKLTFFLQIPTGNYEEHQYF